MHLKYLDIIGFKSFPDRTRLHFGPGMTAVVGPNGSGKSNIADGLRWVMGETSAKTLRGGKMEDVIFNGTAHRRPLGYAEIVMQLDNTDRRLPLEFDEVSVTRRVFRSGESEYLLNGATCRLKDIQLLFMDTGVGRDGYSIIGQGRIDEILSARSEDRRLLFEEAAGIGKFKARRNEALHKIGREQENLARVDDIITELSEQIEPLGIQAEEAKLYLSLKEQYKSVHINIFLEETVRLQDEAAKTQALLDELTAQSQSGHQLLTEARLAGETLKASAAAADIAYKRAAEQLTEAATELEKKESHIRLLESREQNLIENRTRFRYEIQKREDGILDKKDQSEQAQADHRDSERALKTMQTQLAERQDDFAALDEAMRAREEALAVHDRSVMEQMALAAQAKTNAREIEILYERLEEDKERLNSEILHNETRLEEETEKQKTYAAHLRAHEDGVAKQQQQLEAYRQARNQLKESCESLTAEYNRHYAEYQTASSRHKALQQLEAHHEGYYRSVKAVLRMKEQNPQFSGICGAVGALISVPAAYETAIEIALGGSAQHIVVETEADAKRAIDMLKATREGRATFLPLTAVKGRTIDQSKIKNEPGYVGIASELINSDYTQVMAQLLGNIVVMEDMAAALALHKKYRYSYKIVTLEGELLSPGGAITGGSIQKNASGILGRGRQVKELAEQSAALKLTLDNLANLKTTEEGKLQSTEEALNRAAARVQDLRLEQNNMQNILNQSSERLQNLQSTAESCQQENDNLMAQLVEVNGQVRAANKAWAEKEADVIAAREQMENFRTQMADERTLQSEQMQELSDLRVEIGRRTEMLNQIAATIQRLQKEQDILTAEKEAWHMEISESEQREKDIQTEINATQSALEQGRLRLTEQRLALTAMEKEQADLAEAMNQAEAEERLQADETTRLSTAIARLETRKEQQETDSRRLYEEIWEEYGLTYQQAMPYKNTELDGAALRKESQRLKTELNALTNVNVGAIEMYKQIKTRHDFLTTQKEDILKAEADLRALADTLTRQMEEQFIDQFDKIAAHFNDVFKEMFNGGQAGLKLLDRENILESGIEITAQPPGKSLQNLLLLSGGERALTAIALLFAILRLKPSPFCVLDEIEAALDDANVQRFAQFLKQYTDGTQFIIITHRKGTMEAADTLYGVTMQEQGVSKLVSVRFVDTEES